MVDGGEQESNDVLITEGPKTVRPNGKGIYEFGRDGPYRRTTLTTVSADKITIPYPSDGMVAAYSNMTTNSDGSPQSGMGTFKKK